MSINPIGTNTNKHRSSYLGAASVGVLGGLAAKYVIPVSTQEYDAFVSQAFSKGRKKFTKENISTLAKASRSTFDFAVVTALTLMAFTFLKNMYNKLADKKNLS